jgi:hypothetical protein
MRVWIISFLILFGMVEFYQWMKDFTLPLPAFILGGALLAIASNYGKFTRWSFQEQSASSEANRLENSPGKNITNSANSAKLKPSSVMPVSKPNRSISFTIRPPAQDEEGN